MPIAQRKVPEPLVLLVETTPLLLQSCQQEVRFKEKGEELRVGTVKEHLPKVQSVKVLKRQKERGTVEYLKQLQRWSRLLPTHSYKGPY